MLLGTGWRQPKVSRIESGLQLPTEEDIRAWATTVGAEPGPLLALRTLIAAKLRRQAILYEGGRHVVHIIGEAALHAKVGRVTVETMRSQLEHLAETASIPGHELGVVPPR